MKHVDADLSDDATPVLPRALAAVEDQSAPSSSRVLRALDAARTSVWAALGLASAISTYVGVVYWIAQGWLLGVVLSALIPGFGLISTLWSLAG